MKQKIVLYGLSNDIERVYNQLKPCYDIIGLSDRDVDRGNSCAKALKIKYILPEDLKNITFDFVYVTARSRKYGDIHRALVYTHEVPRIKIKPIDRFYEELEFSFGELNPKKTIYVVRVPYTKSGIFAIIHTLFENLIDLPSEYDVFFDLMHYDTTYMKNGELGIKNVWENWFKQPCGMSATEVYNSKCVILSPMGERFMTPKFFRKDKNMLKKYSDAYRKYIIPNEVFSKILEEERKKIFKDNKKVCGVIYRGTDYLKLKPYMHSIHPDCDKMISKVKELRKKWKFDKIYLSTEDAIGQKRFIEEFGEDILYSERELIDKYPTSSAGVKFQDAIVNIKFNRENDEYLKGVEYLRQVYILAECQGLITADNTSLVGAMLISGGFDEEYVFDDLGIYGIDDDSYCTPWGHYVLLQEEKKIEKSLRNED